MACGLHCALCLEPQEGHLGGGSSSPERCSGVLSPGPGHVAFWGSGLGWGPWRGPLNLHEEGAPHVHRDTRDDRGQIGRMVEEQGKPRMPAPPASGRGTQDSPPEPLGKPGPAHTSISDLPLPVVKTEFLLFWVIHMWRSITVAPGPWHVTSVQGGVLAPPPPSGSTLAPPMGHSGHKSAPPRQPWVLPLQGPRVTGAGGVCSAQPGPWDLHTPL